LAGSLKMLAHNRERLRAAQIESWDVAREKFCWDVEQEKLLAVLNKDTSTLRHGEREPEAAWR